MAEAARETPLALSTFARPSFKVVGRNKVQLALSTLAPSIERLEKLRAAKEISHSALCATARVHPSTWFFLRRGEQDPRRDTLRRLEHALAALIEGTAPAQPVNMVMALVRAAEAIILGQVGGDRQLMRALTPDRVRQGKRHRKLPKRIETGRMRRMAIYLAAVELQVSNAELARALGGTRQAIHKARNMIEQMRDNRAVDALLERCRLLLKGEG